MSESIDNFESIKIFVSVSTLPSPQRVFELVFGANDEEIEIVFESNLGVTTYKKYWFKLKRLSTTTMVAYYGGLYTTTFGSPSNEVLTVAVATIDINKIKGIK